MLKKLLPLLLFFAFYFLPFPSPTFAQNKSFLTISYPTRGAEFWPLKNTDPYQNFKFYLNQQQKLDLPATWLFRYDALLDTRITTTARNFPSKFETGLFLEITPQLAQAADIPYRQGHNWADAASVFLSGYSPEDRIKLIDTAISQFQKTLGTTPTAVGAWHIDARSASYLQKTYSVTTLLICADQFSTDQYQLWGGWWSTPYYPSRFHILQPAQTSRNKLNLVVTHWAPRDPLNGYGPADASLYSVQPNDYLQKNLNSDYFLKLLEIYTKKNSNQFGYLNLGIENDYSTQRYSSEFFNQLRIVSEKAQTHQLQVLTLSQFSNWYRRSFPQLSPPHVIEAPDPLGSNQIAIWQMTPTYRLGLIKQGNQTFLRDFRLYQEKFAEPHLSSPNLDKELHLSVPAQADTATHPKELQPISSNQINQLKTLTTPPLLFSTNLKLVLDFYFLLLIFIWLIFKNQKTLAFLLTLGSATLSLPLVKSGLLYEYGMGFWGPHGHDAVWHLSLISHFSRHFNLQHPLLVNAVLKNYHFLFDFLVALIHRLTTIPSPTLYFQILPPLLALALGLSVYCFVHTWTNSRLSSLLSLVFLYFGGNAGWLINLLRNQPLLANSESMFWSSQSISLLINPPLVLSLILLFVGLTLLSRLSSQLVQKQALTENPVPGLSKKKLTTRPAFPRTKPKTLLAILIFGSLIQAKAYAALIILHALLAYSLLSTTNRRPPVTLPSFIKNWLQNPATKVFLGASLISSILFFLFSRSSTNLLVFSPLWFPHTLLSFTDRFNWPQLENARRAYLATHQWAKFLLAETLALTVFLAGNLWTRTLGFIYLAKKILRPKSLSASDAFLFTATLVSLLFSLLFIQRGNPWNTIQFFYYTQVFLGISTAILLSQWLEKLQELHFPKNTNLLPAFPISILLILNLPTTLGTLTQYLPQRAPARISFAELQALKFLKEQPPGRVLTPPFFEQSRNLYPPPKPLYTYETTAYITALSDQPTFTTDYMNLQITGYAWQKNRDQALRYFRTPHTQWAKTFLKNNRIKYLYTIRHHPLLGSFTPPDYLETLYITDEIIIYRIPNNL